MPLASIGYAMYYLFVLIQNSESAQGHHHLGCSITRVWLRRGLHASDKRRPSSCELKAKLPINTLPESLLHIDGKHGCQNQV